MTRNNDHAAHPTVKLDLTVDQYRFRSVREEIDYLSHKAGVESISLHINALSDHAPTACDMHEYLADLRGHSCIPLRAVASGRCCASAVLVLLAFDFEERRCTDGAIFALRQPSFRQDDASAYESDDAVNRVLRQAQSTADRFYRLFGQPLGKSQNEVMRLFGHDDRNGILTPQDALRHRIVSEVISSTQLLAA